MNKSSALTNTTNVLSAVGDLNGDGFPDVLTDVNYTLVALDGSTGDTIWTGPPSSGKNKGTCGAVGMADLDADGSPEAYLGSMVVDGTTGTMRGNGDEGDGLGVGNYYGHSVAADLDDDGLQEVVVGNAAYDADGNRVKSVAGSITTVYMGDHYEVENGMYTGELIKVLRSPGLKIEDVFKRVRLAVRRASRGQQVPWESTS
ncbi:MAG: caspase family protein [Anaerolineales bacterium]|nr:caspase family protein [Anaerolineales bacterium]